MDRKKYLSDLQSSSVEDLYIMLHELRDILSSKFKEQYNRSLPFAEIIFDRWERAKQLNFGERTSIYDSAIVIGDVIVGSNTWIGPHTILDGSGGLKIGSNCSISAGVQLYSHDSVGWAISGGKESYQYAITTIGNNCYIGPNSIIAKGVIIGDGAVVGANSFVNRSVNPNTKVAGNPAQIIS